MSDGKRLEGRIRLRRDSQRWAFELVDSMTAPRELWVFTDQQHNVNMTGALGSNWLGDHHSMALD